jgi:hypothetical protein
MTYHYLKIIEKASDSIIDELLIEQQSKKKNSSKIDALKSAAADTSVIVQAAHKAFGAGITDYELGQLNALTNTPVKEKNGRLEKENLALRNEVAKLEKEIEDLIK